MGQWQLAELLFFFLYLQNNVKIMCALGLQGLLQPVVIAGAAEAEP